VKTLADVLELDEPKLPHRDPVPDTPLRPLDLTPEEFAKSLLNTTQYRESFLRRCLTDSLQPAVEIWLLNTAYGKPVDRLEVADKTEPLESLTAEMVEKRLDRVKNLLELLRKKRKTTQEPESGSRSVH